MVFLASILESYESLVARKIGNTNLTKEDYDQIDPEEMELIDICWCMASVIRKAQWFMEIMGRNSIGGPSTKLGFEKSKVTCFKCKQKGHFKRKCRNSTADETANPFQDDYYKKAVYHRNREEPPRMKQIEETPKEKSRALAVIQDDEGFDWGDFLLEDDAVGFAFMATTEQTKEEKTYILRKMMAQHMKEKIYEAWKEAKRARRWNPDRECYLDPKGNIIVEPTSVDVETLIKSIAETEQQNKIDAAKKAEKERLESKKVDEGIIDTTKEMTAENLTKMADQLLMTNALEVDSKSASSSEGKVSSSDLESRSGKNDCAKIESVCKNCMKECKVCSTHVYLANKRIQELVEKVGRVEKEILNQDKLIKASSERIKELTEKIEKDKSDVERFQKENEKLTLETKQFQKTLIS
ncbi:putative transcription factor interactor and regulator CCHC(Zn) family [Helianthus annuus]|uniref:Transcription factor interactor and regulator CCHC(Zn) family n=1 Tax=Helianthus annuus TaxID=4232 RepID=A0A9K3NYW3_HELAN|nr:putative transcription factor interactor and regulator CCHC(Zn) family [Helianthus annuus]